MHVLISVITGILMFLGLLGTLAPFLPGTPLILLGAIIYGFGFGFDKIGTTIYIILITLTAFSFLVDYVATSIGAGKFGASKTGIIGAVLGAFIGFIVGNIPGFLVGAFLGAFLGEFLRGTSSEGSLRAGIGAVIGFLGGVVTRFLISLAMIGLIVYGAVF